MAASSRRCGVSFTRPRDDDTVRQTLAVWAFVYLGRYADDVIGPLLAMPFT